MKSRLNAIGKKKYYITSKNRFQMENIAQF